MEVRLGDGPHSLLLTHGALCLAEKRLGTKIIDNQEFWSSFESGSPSSISSIAILLYAGLLNEGKPIDYDKLLISLGLYNLKEISEAIAEAIRLHMTPVESPFPKSDGESDPTTAAVTG